MMKKGESFLVTCVTERGLFMFVRRCTDVCTLQNVMTVELRAISDFKRVPRREASGYRKP
jgi:hypothetical protein